MVVRLANGESVCRISAVNGSLPLGGEGGECNEPDEVQPPQRRYLLDNGCFAAYTSPPPAAEPLLKEKPFGECICQLSTPAMPDYHAQPLPRGSGQRSWTQGWRSQTEGEIFKGTDGACADPGTQNFPCHGVHPPAFQFYSSSFYVTHRFFVTFFTEESNVPFSPSPPFRSPIRGPLRPLFCKKEL